MDKQAPTNPPSPKPKLTICPYCGSRSRSLAACEVCRGNFDPLSRQATQNAMGPWFIRDESNPHRPGCAFETVIRLVERGGITGDTVIRGPSSRQFWTLARWCPGIAHLLGLCHNCQRPADPLDTACKHCGASFRVASERQQLGLGEVRFLPGRSEPDVNQDHSPPVPRAHELAGGQPAGPGAAAGMGKAADPRLARLERELRRSRRWRTAWCVGFCAIALLVAGVFVARAIDLNAGPLGRWLAARQSGADGSAVEEGASADITPITTPGLSSGEKAATEQRGSELTAGSGLEAAEISPPADPAPVPRPVDAPEDNHQEPEIQDIPPAIDAGPSRSAVQARLEALAALRRLR